MRESSTMTSLNEDCLYQIFIKLDLHEQLKVSRVCKLFEDIIADWILKPQFHKLDSEDLSLAALENDDIRLLYQLISCNVKRLRITEPINKKLKKQFLYDLDFLFSHDFPNLEEFKAANQQITNVEISVLENDCRKLRNLNIRSFNVTGCHIARMSELRKLTLTGCSISPNYMKEILTNTSITYLKLIKNRAPLEATLLYTYSNTLTELVTDDAVGYGVLLADKLNLRSLHYDTRGISWTDFCLDTKNQIKQISTLMMLKANLQFIGFGKSKKALIFLTDLLTPTNDEYYNIYHMGIFLHVIQLIRSCKNLKSIELEASNVDNFRTLKVLVRELERQQRKLKITIKYTKESNRLRTLRMWLNESVTFKNQNRLTIDFNFLSKTHVNDLHLIKYGFNFIENKPFI